MRYVIKDNIENRYFKSKGKGVTQWLDEAGIYKTLKKAIKVIKRNSDPRLNNHYTIYKVTNKGKIKEYLNLYIKLS